MKDIKEWLDCHTFFKSSQWQREEEKRKEIRKIDSRFHGNDISGRDFGGFYIFFNFTTSYNISYVK